MIRRLLPLLLLLWFCLPRPASATCAIPSTDTGTQLITDINACFAALFPNACAGQQALSSGSPSTATVTNACLTASTNVIECTPCGGTLVLTGTVGCVPSNGSLAITGPNSTTETICWARVK